jgi:hypothetical protein
MTKQTSQNDIEKTQFVWKTSYTVVLVVNAIYIYLFYLLMQNLS